VFDPWSLAHKRWKKLPYLALFERGHLADARLVHVTSPLEARGVRELGIAVPVRCIPLAVTMPEEGPPRRERSDFRMLYLSRLHPVKDVTTLLRAFAQLGRSDMRLTIAGEGDAGYVNRLHALAQDLHINAMVDFAGHLGAVQKQNAWRDHDLFVLPSLHENFSLATIEALATGMPAIVTDQVGVADRIAAVGAGRVVPCGNVGALASALTEMRDDAARRHAAVQARLLVEREFSTGVLRAAYAGLATEIVHRPREAAH
jgi:glycosyltransferase involved in cell wall biosynthesis